MKPTISENKGNVLLYLITTIEEELSLFSSKIEDNQDVTEDDWKNYEKTITQLYQLLNNLKEEIY